jgi:hypothetical protein
MTASDPDEAHGQDAGNRKITQAGVGPQMVPPRASIPDSPPSKG